MVRRLHCRGLWPGHGGELWPAHELRIDGEVIESLVPIEARGAVGYVMPAFVDAHWHMSWAGLEASRLMLDSARSRDELLAIVGAAASVGSGVLRGEKLDESSWPDPTLPSLDELDAVAGPRPVFLRRVCGHLALVNRALLAQLPAETAEQARATGILRERPVFDFDRLAPASPGELRAALARASAQALAEGVTAVCTMEPLASALELDEVDLDVEVRCAVFADDLSVLEELLRTRPARRADWLFGAKIFLDGAIGARTAALGCGFADGTNADLLLDDRALGELLGWAWRLELVPVVHAIGARALEQLERVRRLERARAPSPARAVLRVEHAEQLAPLGMASWDAALDRFCMQPNFVRRWQHPGGLYSQRLARSAVEQLNPFAAVLARGLALGFGSDGMPFGPRWGLAGATLHPTPAQRLTRADALHAYTLGAAAIAGIPELARPIAAGRRADLVVLSQDPLAVADLGDARVLAVLARGKLVWAAEDWTGDAGG